MKNTALFGICVLIVCASAGCLKKENSTKTISNDEASDALIRINVSFSEWYGEQMGAASQIEYILDTKFGNINNSRDPDNILDEQRASMDKVKMKSFPDKEEYDDAIMRWHEHQTNAANCLRLALNKSQIVADPTMQDYKSILDLQREDVAVLKSKLIKFDHLPWRNATGP